MQSAPTIGQAPTNFRFFQAPDLDTKLNTSVVDGLKEIPNLISNPWVLRTNFDLQKQVEKIKDIECRQDDTCSVRAHRIQSLAYAAGTIFLVVIAGMTPRFSYGMTKTYRVTSAIITGLVLLVNSTKAYSDTKKWCKENAVDKNRYWIPIYNEIRYIYTAFLAKSGLGSAHEKLINELNGNLELCKAIDDRWEDVKEVVKDKDLKSVGQVIQFAKLLSEAARMEEAQKEAEAKAAAEKVPNK